MNKEHILSEIVRTAKENGGVPLGMMKFEKETGIRKHDWYGKYWAKWNDAIIEAGLKPNKLQDAHDEEWLLEKLADYIQEINRFPTAGDLRLRSTSDPEFPSSSTLDARLGKKFQKAMKLVEYCRGKEELKDVLEICLAVCNQYPQVDEESIEDVEEEYGYVYLMKSGKYYKIGRSNSAERRNYELNIQLPEKVVLLHKIKTDDPVGIEAYWHKRFEKCRKGGEWFELSSADITAFKRRKFM